MKTLKTLICCLTFSLPALLMICFAQPADAEKANKEEKAVKEGENEGGETRAAVKKNESSARTSWMEAFRIGQQEEITNSVGMRLRLIPAGSFMMGALPGDDKAFVDEKPRHRVEITKAFYIGVYEATQAEWEAVMGTTVRQQRDKANEALPIFGEGSRYPIYYVSWNEAQEFCRKLSQREGVTYRLPTEAEWEYAARGGEDGKLYVWGDEKTPLVNGVKHANVADESIKGSVLYDRLKLLYDRYGYFAGYNDGYAETSPVGTYAPNNFGLYDMAGNVDEWCADWHGENYYGSSPQQDPKGPSSSIFRVLRGGDWGNDREGVRSSARHGFSPVFRSSYYGFRIVRDVE
jgi:sulfatase modifying factor 1